MRPLPAFITLCNRKLSGDESPTCVTGGFFKRTNQMTEQKPLAIQCQDSCTHSGDYDDCKQGGYFISFCNLEFVILQLTLTACFSGLVRSSSGGNTCVQAVSEEF